MTKEQLQALANKYQKFVTEVDGVVTMRETAPDEFSYHPQQRCGKCKGTGVCHPTWNPLYDSWSCTDCNGTGYVAYPNENKT